MVSVAGSVSGSDAGDGSGGDTAPWAAGCSPLLGGDGDLLCDMLKTRFETVGLVTPKHLRHVGDGMKISLGSALFLRMIITLFSIGGVNVPYCQFQFLAHQSQHQH